jgi:phosphoserine phosphatase
MNEFDLYNLEGFIPHDYEAVVAKLSNLALEGVATLHVVSDWDRTLTHNGGGRDITSWGVVQSLLPQEGWDEDQAMYDVFHPKELDGSLTEEEARQWWAASLGLHVNNHTNIRDLQSAVDNVGMQPRPGARELFELCRDLKIPTVVLSAGVKNVIEWVTAKNGMQPSVILATELLTDSEGRVIGWEEDTLIHALNKRERGHDQISQIRQLRPNAILLGDDNEDPGMIDGTDNVVRLQIKDREPTRQEELRSVAVGYDAIVVGSLFPVAALTEWIANANRSPRA